jgi:catechol 2,3-dioxygenase-like lactoylglutathione lyase family enzyme
MRDSLSGVDHVVVVVRDLQRAASTYARLGFTLTPRGEHSLGSQNHCIMFGVDYIELLAVPQAHPALAYYRDFVSHGEGLAAIALGCSDADQAHAALSRAGFAAEPPLEFSRPVKEGNAARDARFRIVQLPVGALPGARAFACQHCTPELVWQEPWRRHAVGATGLAGVALAVEDLDAAANAYARVFDEKPQRIAEGLLVNTGSAPIALASRGSLGRRLDGVALPLRPRPVVAALFIRVADRLQAARTLERSGLQPVRLKDGSLGVGAEQAHGIALVFG